MKTRKSHFCVELTLSSSGGWKVESALLGFAPVVPGSLGISNLRLRPLIIPLSKLPNIWVCKIGLEISHKHAFPSGISLCVCQWSPGLQKIQPWNQRFNQSIAWRPGPVLIDGLLTVSSQLERFTLWVRNPKLTLREASVDPLGP